MNYFTNQFQEDGVNQDYSMLDYIPMLITEEENDRISCHNRRRSNMPYMNSMVIVLLVQMVFQAYSFKSVRIL